MDLRTEYFVLIKDSAVFTKTAPYFEEQGGLTSEWGQAWEKVEAVSLLQARLIAIAARRKRYPYAHQTLDEEQVTPEIVALMEEQFGAASSS